MATEFELAVLQELGEIKAMGAATAATVTGLNQRLFEGDAAVIPVIKADIKQLQSDASKEIWWDRAKVALGPTLVGIHMFLHRIGWKV